VVKVGRDVDGLAWAYLAHLVPETEPGSSFEQIDHLLIRVAMTARRCAVALYSHHQEVFSGDDHLAVSARHFCGLDLIGIVEGHVGFSIR